MSAYRSILTTIQANHLRKQPLCTVPEIDYVKHRVKHVGYGAVMAVLWIGVVKGVMFGGLQEPNVLQE